MGLKMLFWQSAIEAHRAESLGVVRELGYSCLKFGGDFLFLANF